MGVTGLWRLIEPAGKPVPVETLENKVLAVDVSIWLHQMVKGYQDAKGAPLPNAHLVGLFQRLCKLLYFRIKPVFVFDGVFPELKKETIAKRQDSKAKYQSDSERIKREIALLLSKRTAIGSLLGKDISPKKCSTDTDRSDDIFKLPALPQKEESESESEEETSSGSIVDLHSVDIESDKFKKLSAKEKYDMLVELKETRKMNSWGKLHELPKKSDTFSDFQMRRLLKRRKVQECLEETEKEMGDAGMSLNDLESLLNEEGIDTKIQSLPTRRIASNNCDRYLLINDLKQVIADAKKKKEIENIKESKVEENLVQENTPPRKDELEEDLEKAIKMSLECVNEPNTSACTSKTDDSWTSFMTDSDYTDSEEDDGFEQPVMSTAKAYIMQYSDFTHKAIDKIVATKTRNDKSKSLEVNKIIDELYQEKSIVVDNIELSSDEEYTVATEKTNESIVELNTTEECSAKNETVAETSQSSIISIKDFVQNITSENFDNSTIDSKQFTKASDSSDDEFEEVEDSDSKKDKNVLQLTLKMGDAPEDDIFADIFTDKTVNAKHDTETELNDEIISQFEPKDISVRQTVEKILKLNNKDMDKMDIKEINKIEEDNTQDLITEKVTLFQSEKEVDSMPESSNEIEIQDKQVQHNDTSEQRNIEINSALKVVNKSIRDEISTEKLNSMVEEIQNEEKELLQEKGRLDRIGRNITEQMTQEAQELLQIFGIPYIVAPMEAEAQCAFLESVKLTDGTITDDSDIWLFGGRTVYKNFFNHKKHVLQFLSDRIEKSFNLTREQLILLALLVGSDYTTGVAGVGPVTAMEILASFPFNKKIINNDASKQEQYRKMIAGLQEFKQWVWAGKRTDNTTLKKKLRNVKLSDDFPSVRVVQAYLEPNVEKSEDKFTWGELDITVLRDYTKAKFGWSQNKLDEIIKPVLKRIADRKNQKTVQDYFKRKIVFQSLDEQMSKRVKAAVQKMGPGIPGEESPVPEGRKAKKIRKRRKHTIDEATEDEANTITSDQSKAGPSKPKQCKDDEVLLTKHAVKVVTQNTQESSESIEIKIKKSDRVQEIIPQREKDKQNLLQNKLKAIEVFRKAKIDRKKRITKKRLNLPKKQAELSESSDSN